jgi:hypothetical protein
MKKLWHIIRRMWRVPMTPFPLAFVDKKGIVHLEIMWHQITNEEEYKMIRGKHLEESRERLFRARNTR